MNSNARDRADARVAVDDFDVHDRSPILRARKRERQDGGCDERCAHHWQLNLSMQTPSRVVVKAPVAAAMPAAAPTATAPTRVQNHQRL